MNPIGIVFRRIIYAIPLKVLLLLLAVFGVLFVCFSSADYLDGLTFLQQINLNNSSVNSSNVNNYFGIIDNESYLCFNIVEHNTNGAILIRIGSTQSYLTVNGGVGFGCLGAWNNAPFVINENGGDTTVKINVYKLPRDGFQVFSITSGNPGYTSLQCQTEYNLIPISSVDQNYCTTNNLCPAGTPSDCPNVGVSNLYINDLFHPGAFNIIMNIPEEIDWDYAYTNSGQNINIDVVGYNQDFEKIEGWIETNNYKPTSEDFTKIFTSFSSFGGLLIACLFVILVFYFVKKMFK